MNQPCVVVAALAIASVIVSAQPSGSVAQEVMRLARAAEAQRHLVASAAQQEREARAAAAQQEQLARAATAQRRLVAHWTRCLKLKYEDALAAPLPARLATFITQLETQDVSA